MKLKSNASAEFKSISSQGATAYNSNSSGQMIAPGASSCTLGCSCSCSCGTTKK